MSIQHRGIIFPLNSGGSGMFARSGTTLQVVQSNLINLIKTRRGERVNHPTFGTDLHRLLFAPATQDTASLVESMIRDTVDFWLPDVIITQLSSIADPNDDTDGHTISVRMSFALRSNPSIGSTVTFSINK